MLQVVEVLPEACVVRSYRRIMGVVDVMRQFNLDTIASNTLVEWECDIQMSTCVRGDCAFR